MDQDTELESSPTEVPEQDVIPTDTDVPEEPAVEAPEDEGGEDSEPPKKKGGFQRRIQKLTERNKATQLQLAELASNNAELKRKLDAIEAQQRDAVAAGQAPKVEDFEDPSEYTQALVDYKTKVAVQEAMRKFEAQNAETGYTKEQAERAARWAESEHKARETFEDYDDIVDPNAVLPNAVLGYVMESEMGAMLAYKLFEDPTKLTKLARMTPIAVNRELAKMEVALSGPVKVSKAPAPIVPVGGRQTDGGSKESIDAWIAKRNAQIRGR